MQIGECGGTAGVDHHEPLLLTQKVGMDVGGVGLHREPRREVAIRALGRRGWRFEDEAEGGSPALCNRHEARVWPTSGPITMSGFKAGTGPLLRLECDQRIDPQGPPRRE